MDYSGVFQQRKHSRQYTTLSNFLRICLLQATDGQLLYVKVTTHTKKGQPAFLSIVLIYDPAFYFKCVQNNQPFVRWTMGKGRLANMLHIVWSRVHRQ